MRILFSDAAADAFAELPESTKKKIASLIELVRLHPRMYPVRQRGLMHGCRYFVVDRNLVYLVYYRVSSQEVRIAAVMPGMMRRA